MGGNFGISLESGNNPVFAGSHLKGFVFCGMTKGVKATDVSLRFVGMEKTKVVSAKTKHTTYGTRNIVQANLSLKESTQLKFNKDGFIVPGNYKLPFAIELPASLPSTMQINDGDNYCKTEYDLMAALQGPTSNAADNHNTTSDNLQYYSFEKRLLLKAFPLEHAVPFSSAPIKQDFSFLGCKDRGSLSFGVRLDNLRIQRGESVQLKMSCRNASNVRVLKFSGHLIEINHWKSGNETVTTQNKLMRIIIDDIPGMEAVKDNHRRTDDDVRRDLSNMYRELETGKFRETLKIPNQAHSSYEGTLLKIEHVLVLRLATDCFYENHVVNIPLQICEAVTKVKTSGVVGTSDDIDKSTTILVTKHDHLQLGGSPVESQREHTSSVSQQPIQLAPALYPSLSGLVQAMDYSVIDLDAIEDKAADKDWQTAVFSQIQPPDFSTVLNAVRTPFDVPEVAAAIAQAMNSSKTGSFTCKHIISALPVVPDWNLALFVKKLLPFCTSDNHNRHMLLESLTYWERLLTDRAFSQQQQHQQHK